MAMADNGRLNDVLVKKKSKAPSMTVNKPEAGERQQREVKSSAPVKEKYDHIIRYDAGTRPATEKKPVPKAAPHSSGSASADEFIGKASEKATSIVRVLKAPDAPPTCCTYFKRRGKVDIPLLLTIIILAVFGLVIMSSASYAQSLFENRDSYDSIKQQIYGMLIGFGAMLFFAFMDYKIFITPIIQVFRHFGRFLKDCVGLKKKPLDEFKVKGNGLNAAHILFFIFGMFLMILTCVAGEEVAGARRWITLFGVRFQPSELMKISLILVMAYMLQRYYESRKKYAPGFARYVFVFALCAITCVAQRHFSAVIIVTVICYAMMFAGDVSVRKLFGLTVLIVVAAIAFVILFPDKISYIVDRIDGWFAPFGDTTDTTYQTSQSLITIGSGGLFGRGLGNSIMKYYYLPEAQNDFVFSIVCEELGLVGGITVILLFVFFGYRGYKISKGATDTFGSLLALGITVQLVLQAFFNIGVACNALPNTGISLPFFSYGRTALTIQLAEAGILLSISRNSET